MNISFNNNINFTGIKLSNPSFEFARDVAMHLKRTGSDVLGHKTFYVNNEMESKRKFFEKIRYKNVFAGNTCAFVMLPWSSETYIIASPNYEQFVLPVVRQLDKAAKINLSI